MFHGTSRRRVTRADCARRPASRNAMRVPWNAALRAANAIRRSVVAAGARLPSPARGQAARRLVQDGKMEYLATRPAPRSLRCTQTSSETLCGSNRHAPSAQQVCTRGVSRHQPSPWRGNAHACRLFAPLRIP
ncbi:MAG: hypothetical protein OJF55_000921 [Rhodanobacteraceae bacterium]|nr:MAG: hypothetical protein OJF55_000921 [Rhodanobacteraceae bacterium]